MRYDLIVAGGGMSGIAAAVAAGRKGLNVLLVEQSSMLGGQGTGGMISMVMSSEHWFYGIGKELIDGLIARGKASWLKNYPVKGYNRYPFDVEAMKSALDDIVLKSGVKLLLYTKVIGVERENNCLTKLLLAGPAGNFSVESKLFVDATGDAMLSYYAGEPFEVGDEHGNTQAPTMGSYYAGVDFERYEEFLKTYADGDAVPKVNMIRDLIPKGVKDGVVSVEDMHHPGIFRITPDCNVGLMNAGHVYGANCVSVEGLTDAAIQGRKIAAEYLEFYRRYIPGFENAYLTNTGNLGLRETRRVMGQYVTTFEDKSSYRKFDDAIMRFDGGAVSDVHASSPDKKAYQDYYQLYNQRDGLRENDYATLPYRSILAKNTKNLLIVGRCVSADRKVQGEIRIMGYCFMMGEAAGLAAAVAIAEQKILKDIDISNLQAELKKNGIETK